jgi:hypothetical protein
VKDVLEVITLDGLLRVKKLEEFLYELRSDVDFETTHFYALIDDQL